MLTETTPNPIAYTVWIVIREALEARNSLAHLGPIAISTEQLMHCTVEQLALPTVKSHFWNWIFPNSCYIMRFPTVRWPFCSFFVTPFAIPSSLHQERSIIETKFRFTIDWVCKSSRVHRGQEWSKTWTVLIRVYHHSRPTPSKPLKSQESQNQVTSLFPVVCLAVKKSLTNWKKVCSCLANWLG